MDEMDEMDAKQRFLFEILSSFHRLNVAWMFILFRYRFIIIFFIFCCWFGSLMRLAAKQHPFPWQMVFISIFFLLWFWLVAFRIQTLNADFLSVFLIVSHNHRHSHKNTKCTDTGIKNHWKWQSVSCKKMVAKFWNPSYSAKFLTLNKIHTMPYRSS